MNTLFVDALKFLTEHEEWNLKDFSKRHYLQSVIQRLASPSERQRLTLELESLTDEDLNYK